MGQFKFIHVADIHLDSPLKGLEGYDGAPVDAIRQASRHALANLVDAAIQHEVDFVVIAGDLYDGDWRNFNTGLFFVSQMTRLRSADIPAFVISGNHDAANKMTKDLPLPDNIKRLATDRCETVRLEHLGVSIHGQGFATAAVQNDLSAAYCPADQGNFNLGLLHTSAGGFEGHERYAPCTVDGLRAKGYDYWALGHIHKRHSLHKDDEPPIVFPGNIQGRHIRETGPKGCMLVTVDGKHRAQCDFLPLDVFRWERCEVAADGAESPYDVLDRVSDQLQQLVRNSDGRTLAVRIEVTGTCRAHEKLASEPERWKNELRSLGVELGGGDLWIEKIKLRSSLPCDEDSTASEGPVDDLVHQIAELASDPAHLEVLSGELAELRRKLPIELREGPDAIGLDDAAWLSRIVDDAQHLLIDRLRAARDG